MIRHLSPFVLVALVALPAGADTLTFTLTGVETHPGTLYVGVQTEEQFEKQDGVAGDVIAAPAAGTHTFTYELPAGEYSISVWHDINADGQFSLDEYGIPADGWAAINGASLRAQPKFHQVSFTLKGEPLHLTEAIIYPG